MARLASYKDSANASLQHAKDSASQTFGSAKGSAERNVDAAKAKAEEGKQEVKQGWSSGLVGERARRTRRRRMLLPRRPMVRAT